MRAVGRGNQDRLRDHRPPVACVSLRRGDLQEDLPLRLRRSGEADDDSTPTWTACPLVTPKEASNSAQFQGGQTPRRKFQTQNLYGRELWAHGVGEFCNVDTILWDKKRLKSLLI